MADNGKDSKRATFNDYEHPLRTDDAAAQKEVTARIKQAMRTGKKRPKEPERTSGRFVISGTWDGSIPLRGKRYVRKPMGQRPRLTQADLVDALGVKDQPAVSRLINSPGDMSVDQVFVLKHALGVTLDWLRYEGENRYGTYEDDSRVVGALYDRLTPHDKEHVFYMLTTLLGDEAEREVISAETSAYMQRWLLERPEEREKIEAISQRISKRWKDMFGTGSWQDLIDKISRAMQGPKIPLPAESVRGFAAHALKTYSYGSITKELSNLADAMRDRFDSEHGKGSYDLAVRTGEALEARGVDLSGWTMADVLAAADSVDVS